MEGIIFIGIQATGKSTFYKNNFFNTHVRISLDLLNTRNREFQILDKCLELQQRVVIDNTNPTSIEREKYIDKFFKSKYKIIGYYFQSKIEESLDRNRGRIGKDKISEIGILSTHKKMELPTQNEGFDELYYVELINNNFFVKKWDNEI